MNADAPPIAADEVMVDDGRKNFGNVANCSAAICQVFIGGNRRGIGVHRRFQRLLTA
ncbi:MAG: hypothetical protein KF776_07650 [Burkholderiales bacterium]|nr:hypothetical protein [Burkholderiales bacterium]